MVTRRDVIIGAGAAGSDPAAVGFPAIAEQGPFRIGVFVSEADRYQPDQFNAMVEPYVSQMRLGLELAASEINAAGGLIGRRIEFAYVDDGGSPPARAAVLGLINQNGVEAIVSGFVQAAPRLVTTHMGADNHVPVLHGFWVDGSYCGPLAKHFGPTIGQVVPRSAHISIALRRSARSRSRPGPRPVAPFRSIFTRPLAIPTQGMPS